MLTRYFWRIYGRCWLIVRPPDLSDPKSLGKWGENYAAIYLKTLGWRIVGRNFATSQGEVDIVAQEAQILHFVEVKTRQSDLVDAVDQLHLRKQAKIQKAAYSFVKVKGYAGYSLQFDLVCIYHQMGTTRLDFYPSCF